ncbi:hypothetical protein DMUE_3338 [Dictyocoela muelleri]|nr:hypothetical protein DMUE_3338 [Dictyocoela muelleri]
MESAKFKEWFICLCSIVVLSLITEEYARHWSVIIVVPGKTFSLIIRDIFREIMFKTGIINAFFDPLSTPPTYYWPFVIRPRLYLRFKNKLSSISKIILVPSSFIPPNISLLEAINSHIASLTKSQYSETVPRSIYNSYAISIKDLRLMYL